MKNFTPIRNGLLDHLERGRFSPFDLGVYMFLHLHADWATGIYRGCALGIAFGFGDSSLKHHIQKALRRLRDRGYINYKKGDGTRGNYSILIDKYEPRVGELLGTRLDAWKSGDLAEAEYESKNGEAAVGLQSSNGSSPVAEPIQEQKNSTENQLVEQNTAKCCTKRDLSGAGTTQPSSKACQLATLLKSEILRNRPAFRITSHQEHKWAKTADLMLKVDKRTWDEMAEVIRWVQHDEFWFKNILSMDKLREKFDQLALYINAAAQQKPKLVAEDEHYAPKAPQWPGLSDNLERRVASSE